MAATLLCVVFCGLILMSVSENPPVQEEEIFLQKIFNLYGDNYHITFEGFEHLMENLGLGGLKFDKNHSLSMHKESDGSFIEVHDRLNLHKHNHSRQERSLPLNDLEEKCLSPETILSLYGLEPGHRVSITPQGFMRICPAIVYQLDRRACSSPPTILKPARVHKKTSSITTQAWIGASLSILVISISGLVGVAVVPCLERSMFRRLLSTLVALAVGTLCGDALLHLLPHAYGLDDNQKVTMRSSSSFLAIMGFFVVEAVITAKQACKKKKKQKYKEELVPNVSMPQEKGDYAMVESEPSDSHCHSHGDKNGGDGIGSVAWMVVSGDSLHNITDGLAVGAAFRADSVSGLATAIAVLTHEVPHEIGDFAVLLKSGMTVKQAIFINLLSSILSFIGMAAGIMLGNIESATSYIYCITAGCFLYIGLADLVPELHKYRSKGGDIIPNIILQVGGLFTGGSIMFIIALYEHSLHHFLAGESDMEA